MRPLRIALITHKVDFQDGQGRVNYELVRELLQRGHSVTVVAEVCSPEIAAHPNGRFVRTPERRLPTQLLRDHLFAIRAGEWLRGHRGEFDLVQANGAVMWEPADVVAVHYVHSAWLKNPYFPYQRPRTPYALYQRLQTALSARYERRALRTARRLVAVSEATRDEVIGLGIDPSKIRVVPNGVDIAEFHPGASVREEFGLPAGVPMALFAGDIKTPRKNLDTTLQALSHVAQLHLAVAGAADGSPYPELARRLGVANRVHFLGLTDRMAYLMRSVDLFVIPSRYESYGMVVVEAMATGLPVILSSRVGAVGFARETSLVLEDPEDVQGLAGFLDEVLTDLNAAKARGRQGRERALQLQWPAMTDGYIAAYEELLAGNGG